MNNALRMRYSERFCNLDPAHDGFAETLRGRLVPRRATAGRPCVGAVRTAAGKPAIFVPFPQAADDHQKCNAEALVRAGAAELIPEAELSVERLVKSISTAFSDPARLQRMAQNARALSHPRAAAEIAEMAAELMKSG